MKAIRTIGFTGTIASGKTSRCKHLVEVAERRQRHRCPPPAERGVGAVAPSTSEGKAVPSPTTSAALSSSSSSSTTSSPAVAVHYINADLVGHHIYEPGKPCYHALLQHFGTSILSAGDATAHTATTTTAAAAGAAAGAAAAAPPLIDRRVLGEIVFAEERKLQELNAICWPFITAGIKEEYARVCARYRGTAPLLTGASARKPVVATTAVTAAAAAAAAPPGGPAVVLIIVEAALLCEMTEVLDLTTDLWMTHCTPATAVDRVMVRNHLSREAAQQRVASQLDVEQKLRKLRHLAYKGGVEVFDTTQVKLAEGLRETEAAFDRYWREKIAVHL
ncbi:Dephospho-CoA kinase [Novymonas esmeraldas]|uniref:Dephospho-CoA kinase n=1 Tax=Novymonas esmeraldas TaxID=1808958 RepID=A0AAW0ET70_9TRYP